MMNRRQFAAAALLSVLAAPAIAQDNRIPLAEISAYLNRLTTGESTFTQYNENGSRSTGRLYVKRPGRMRFEYDPPNKGLVLAGGGTVLVRDEKSNQAPETYPLRRTPLSIILQRNVDLSRADMVVGYGQEDEFTVVRAQDPENPEYGFIDLKFSRDPVTLRQWVVTNELGDRTAVVLDGMTTGVSLSDNLFNTQIGRGGNRR
ncbi:LolA family protein [Heliomarina baculiformis]|uniref:LolA family protein n=1 Tax=Heliomarina baculiformis TaxID=2872036 RepID=UPI001EE183F7|nr:outer membrane lipoprotein carrier protein LolA [Heliomarina baculiformis]